MAEKPSSPPKLIVRSEVTFRDRTPAEIQQERFANLSRNRKKKLEVTDEVTEDGMEKKWPLVEMRLRIQTVQDLHPCFFDLDPVPGKKTAEKFYQKDSTLELKSGHVGMQLCAMEVCLKVRGCYQAGDRMANYVGGALRYYLFRHEVIFPRLKEFKELCDHGGIDEEGGGFFPSIQGMAIEVEGDDAGERKERVVDFGKKGHNKDAAVAQLIRKRYLDVIAERQNGDVRGSHVSQIIKTPRDYIEANDVNRDRARLPADAVINLPAQQALAKRWYTKQNTLAMAVRDFTVNMNLTFLRGHVPLTGLKEMKVVQQGSPRDGEAAEVGDLGEAAMSPGTAVKTVSLRLSDVDVPSCLQTNVGGSLQLGFFEETLEQLQNSGRNPGSHFVGHVLEVSDGDQEVIVRVLVRDTLDVEAIQCVTILPDVTVARKALALLSLADFDPDKPVAAKKDPMKDIADRMERVGVDAAIVVDEEPPEEKSSATKRLKMRVKDALNEVAEGVWTPLPVPAGESDKREYGRRYYGSLAENTRQQRFVNRVVRMGSRKGKKIAVLHGPPGTGKTTTDVIAVLAHHDELNKNDNSKEKPRSLLVAPTNTAADALMKSMVKRLRDVVDEHGQPIPEEEWPKVERMYCASYDQHKISPEYQRFSFIYGSSKSELTVNEETGMLEGEDETSTKVREADVLICTLDTALLRFAELFKSGYFTLAVVDEAGRVPIAQALPILCMAPCVVLSGDHKQMRPFYPSQFGFLTDLHWDISIMQFLLDLGHPLIQLTQNYRSVEAILAPSNKHLYASDPMTSEVSQERTDSFRDLCKRFPFLLDYFRNPGLAVAPVSGSCNRPQKGMSWFNMAEAHHVVDFIVKAEKSGLAKVETVGVVTFYNAQLTAINIYLDLLRKDGVLEGKQDWLQVYSADRFQGLEASFILVTGCRADEIYLYDGGPRDIGFVAHFDRINVAVTRAKYAAVLFLQPAAYLKNHFWSSVIEVAGRMDNFSRATTECSELHWYLFNRACSYISHSSARKVDAPLPMPEVITLCPKEPGIQQEAEEPTSSSTKTA
jgi:hypothetical protein